MVVAERVMRSLMHRTIQPDKVEPGSHWTYNMLHKLLLLIFLFLYKHRY